MLIRPVKKIQTELCRDPNDSIVNSFAMNQIVDIYTKKNLSSVLKIKKSMSYQYYFHTCQNFILLSLR